MDNGTRAIIISLIGSVIIALVTHFLGRPQRQSNDAATIRGELWKELGELRDMLDDQGKEILALKTSVDEWRGKYYLLLDEYIEFKSAYRILIGTYNNLIRMLHNLRSDLKKHDLENLVPTIPEEIQSNEAIESGRTGRKS